MKSIWVLTIVLAFAAGSILTGTMAEAKKGGDTGAQGQQGERGPQGEKGPPGTPPTDDGVDDGTTLALLLRSTNPDQQRLVDMYSDDLSESDYVVTFLGASNIDYALQLPGKTVATYVSIPDIRNQIPSLIGKVEYIAYDLEHSLSPTSETNDPVQSINDACDLVRANGFKCMITPSGQLTDPHVVGFAQALDDDDVFILQFQARQVQP